MTDPVIRRILALVEFSSQGEPDLRYAIDLAAQLDAELFLFGVIDTPAMVSLIGKHTTEGGGDTLSASLVQDAKRILLRIVNDAASQGVKAVGHATISEEVPEQILKEAVLQHADLILLRSKGRSGMLKALLGSTVGDILKAAPCPVLVARA